MKPATFATIGFAILQVSCSRVQYTTVSPHYTDWRVHHDVLEYYGYHNIQEALDIWCDSTEGAYCPTVEISDISPTIVVMTGYHKVKGFWGYWNSVEIELSDETPDECEVMVMAHEIGHALRLRFGKSVHSTEGLMVQRLKRSECHSFDSIDDITLDAFDDKYAIKEH